MVGICISGLRVLYKLIPDDQYMGSAFSIASKCVIGTLNRMVSDTSHWQCRYDPPPRTQPPSRKRWLHFCESGSDIQEAPALASATEAVFTRILPQQGSDCIWSAGQGHSGFVRRAFLSLVMTPRCYCWANGVSLPEKDLKRATATEILIWTICVFLPSTKPWLWGVGGSWRRVTVRLKEKHPGILCC